MHSDVDAGCLAPDRISNRTPLMSRSTAVRGVICHGDFAPQCQLGFLDNGFRCALPAAASRHEATALLRNCADADVSRTVLAGAQRSKCAAVSPRNWGDTVAEELTAKEQEVLRLLATRLSRREIGRRLYVSLNTVKTHQRALYRKLGVENRAAAVARARDLGLL